MVDSVPSSFFFDNASTTSTDHGWAFDSSSMVNVSKNTSNLSSFTPYSGLESIQVGNGQLLPIFCIGGKLILTSNGHTFSLHNILICLNITKNLVSVYKE